jgi:hypothetical protein
MQAMRRKAVTNLDKDRPLLQTRQISVLVSELTMGQIGWR